MFVATCRFIIVHLCTNSYIRRNIRRHSGRSLHLSDACMQLTPGYVASAASLFLRDKSCHAQASGEAVYTSDIGVGSDDLFAALVGSTQALATITSIDPAPALAVSCVIIFLCTLCSF